MDPATAANSLPETAGECRGATVMSRTPDSKQYTTPLSGMSSSLKERLKKCGRYHPATPPSGRPNTTSNTPPSGRPNTTSNTPPSGRPTTTSNTPPSGRPNTTSNTPPSGRPNTTSNTPPSGRPNTTSNTPPSGRPNTTSNTPPSGRPNATSNTPTSGRPNTTSNTPTSGRPNTPSTSWPMSTASNCQYNSPVSVPVTTCVHPQSSCSVQPMSSYSTRKTLPQPRNILMDTEVTITSPLNNLGSLSQSRSGHKTYRDTVVHNKNCASAETCFDISACNKDCESTHRQACDIPDPGTDCESDNQQGQTFVGAEYSHCKTPSVTVITTAASYLTDSTSSLNTQTPAKPLRHQKCLHSASEGARVLETLVAASSDDLRETVRRLRADLAERKEVLRKLNMVKTYRAKHNLQQLQNLINKWRLTCQQAVLDLHQLTCEPRPSLTQLIQQLGIDQKLVHYHQDDECFDDT